MFTKVGMQQSLNALSFPYSPLHASAFSLVSFLVFFFFEIINKDIFTKEGLLEPFPPSYLTLINYIEFHSTDLDIIILPAIKGDIISCLHKGIDLDLPTFQHLIAFNFTFEI
jgi:hypothetical protein